MKFRSSLTLFTALASYEASCLTGFFKGSSCSTLKRTQKISLKGVQHQKVFWSLEKSGRNKFLKSINNSAPFCILGGKETARQVNGWRDAAVTV